MTEVEQGWDETLRLSLARLLRKVEELALELHGQALASPNARDFPGGRALNMLGPAAVLQDWEARYQETEEAERWAPDGSDRWEKRRRLDPVIDQIASEEQPLSVLSFWTRVIREELEQPTGLKPTISREADYLRKIIDWMLRPDEFGDPEWMECFEVERDLKALVRRMEDVLHSGIRAERTRVTCTRCESKARLVRLYGATVRFDRYRCPACRESYDHREFVMAKKQNLADEGTDRFVLVVDAQDAGQIPKNTMRSWMRRMVVVTACDLQTRRVMVWWPDVRVLIEQRRRASDAS